MKVSLLVLVGKAKGREIPLPSTQVVIGRLSVCHLRSDSELVSKLHCAIGRKAGHVLVRDLNSRNRTYINGKAIIGTVRVKDSDVLAVGPLRFRFAITGEEGVSPVQTICKGHIQWLMESPHTFESDSNCGDTAVISVPPHLSEEDEADQPLQVDSTSDAGSGASGGDDNLSAGRYLHDYFSTRKPR